MRQEIFEKILVSLYPNKKITIKEYTIHERYEFNNNFELMPINPSIFVGIQTGEELDSNNIDSNSTLDVENMINKFTSNDFNIYKI